MSNEMGTKKGAAVTLDLWQTLILDDRELGERRAQLRIDRVEGILKAEGAAFSQERLWHAYRETLSYCAVIRDSGRDISFDDQIWSFVERISAGLGSRISRRARAELGQAYDRAFFDYPPPMHPEASRMIGELKGRGYKLGVVSNTGATSGTTMREYLGQMGVLGYFDTLVFSDEARLAKPNTKIYQSAMKALGVSPECAVHVGDDPRNDVAAAKLAGMRVVWVPNGKRAQEMEEGQPKPDATVGGLGEVVEAVEGLVG
ncbi:MAG: HAD family hydrolase [SAR202 cluster bacterium]|nr:HAD family hydrolase [SAR202 cluster bacterium]